MSRIHLLCLRAGPILWAGIVVACLAGGLAGRAHADAGVPGFFDALYRDAKAAYAHRTRAEYRDFCRRHGLKADSPANQDAFLRIRCHHDLFTGSACRDFARGGILGIPYLWHWRTPNPRHTLTYRPDGVPLSQVPPAAGYDLYKSLADVDRVPAVYLGDLFTPHPLYAHPRIGPFHSFGWCSEREMAFCLLMDMSGFTAKVRQSGIHTVTCIWHEFEGDRGEPVPVIARVDNSVNTLSWWLPGPETDKAAWQKDVGRGSTVGWYNIKAHDPEQKKILVRTDTTSPRGLWIRRAVKRWLTPDSPAR